jgi:hypothetical protein
MGDRADDPVDHARTTLKHAGQDWKNTRAMPGLIAVGLSSAAVFIALFAFATSHVTAGVWAAVVAAILFGGGLGWLTRERRRVRRVEVQYVKDHPGTDIQPPSS